MPEFDLCVITRPALRPGAPGHLEIARAALEGGARLIELRDKEAGGGELFALGQELRLLARQYQALLIINDRADIAQAVGAEGVHLGQFDLPVSAARRLLGPEAVIGASVATVEEAKRAEADGASYVSVGAIFPSGSKADAGEAIGLGPIGEIKRNVGLSVLVIGGISRDNVEAVVRAGADGVAVISAVADAPDMTAATAELLRGIRAARSSR